MITVNEKVLYCKSWLTSKYINSASGYKYDFKSVLIIKNDEIGDLVTALPVFYNLNERYPNAAQTLVCKPFNTIFFKHIPFVKCHTNFDDVSGNTYDLIVELRGSEETRKYSLSQKPKIRLDRGGVRLFNKFNGGQKNEIDTNLQIIKQLFPNVSLSESNRIVVSSEEVQKVSKYIELAGISHFVILHLGARDRARRWPVEHFAETINYINTTYSLPCVLVGGPDDMEINEECLELVTSKFNYNVVGEFDLLEYAALCDKASLFVGNESGPLHIAAAMNTPNIALFGPGVKDVFYPKNDKSIVHHYFLARGHKTQTVENSTIFSIQVNEVKASIDKILS
mgnify:FL=1